MKQNKYIIFLILIVIFLFLIIFNKNKINNFPKSNELASAKKINKDTIGWIYIPKTNINYPIMYKDNNYYLDHSFEKYEATSGSIYTLNNKIRQNMVITGHNSRVSVSKFYWLHNIRDVNMGLDKSCYEKNDLILLKEKMPNFENKKDKIWYVSIYDLEGKWEIWSMYETPYDESSETQLYNTWSGEYYPKNKEKIDEWIKYQLQRSEYDFKNKVTSNDQFLTIYTCGCQYYEGTHESRLYYFLKKI